MIIRELLLAAPFIADRDGFGVRSDGSGGAVDGHQLPWMQTYRGVAGGDDGGDSVLAGHQGGVRSEAAAVGDDGGCSGEQRRPCRSGGFRDKHIAVAETAEVLRALHDAYRSGSASRGCGVPDDDVLADFSLTTGFLHGAADHIPDQPNRLPECQGRGEAALPLPQVAALPHEVNNRLTGPNPKRGSDFFVVQKNTSSTCSIAPVATMCSPSRRTQARRIGHARVKSRACSSRMTAYR